MACACGYIHGPDCPLSGGWDDLATYPQDEDATPGADFDPYID